MSPSATPVVNDLLDYFNVVSEYSLNAFNIQITRPGSAEGALTTYSLVRPSNSIDVNFITDGDKVIQFRLTSNVELDGKTITTEIGLYAPNEWWLSCDHFVLNPTEGGFASDLYAAPPKNMHPKVFIAINNVLRRFHQRVSRVDLL